MDNKIVPLLTIGAVVDKQIERDNFFSEDDNPIFNLVKDPKYLRYSGWNMLTLDYPKIKNGDHWEVTNGGRKTIRLYDDGALVAFAYANNEFLGWGKSDSGFLESPILNSLATIEYIYEFVRFYKDFLKIAKIEEANLTFRIKLSNVALISGKKLRIRTSNVLSPFLESSEEIESDSESDILIPYKNADFDLELVAFKLISKVYLWFGVPQNKIPYTKVDEKGVRRIDIQSFNPEVK